MANVFDTEVSKLITEAAKDLKKLKELQPPEWAAFVKTGSHKQRPPIDPDWWFVRAASVLRTIYVKGPIGVAKLKVKYGGRKNMGMKPEHSVKGSGNILRKVLQQLEKAGLAKQAQKGVHKGRIITPKGISLLAQAGKRVK